MMTTAMNSRWNEAASYANRPEHYNADTCCLLPLSYVPREQSATAFSRIRTEAEINDIIAEGKIDSLCVEMVCRIAASKYLTTGMLCDFLELQGLCAARSEVKARLELLESCGFVQRITCHVSGQTTLRCYTLGENGGTLAQQAGVANYNSLRYQSRQSRIDAGFRPEVPAHSIKRCLQANRVILGILQKGVPVERFGLMQTLSAPNYRNTGCIVCTSAALQAEGGQLAMLEVVRRTPGAELALADKLARFSQLCSQTGGSNPVFLICGEDTAHNRQLYQALVSQGLLNCAAPVCLLFTSDIQSLRYPGRFDSFSGGVRHSVLWPGYPGELTQKEAA